MTRKYVFAYTALLLATFSGMLMAIAPPLAAEPIGFSVVYLIVLAVSLGLDALMALAFARHRLLSVCLLILVTSCMFVGMGAPGWSVLALVLNIVAYIAVKRTKAAEVKAEVAKHAGEIPNSGPVDYPWVKGGAA